MMIDRQRGRKTDGWTDRRTDGRQTEPRTCGSVGGTSGCHAGGREFDSGRTNTQDLKTTE